MIDEAFIIFSPGFTIITGETGAGKSIMLGALSLLLGERAETKAITDKNAKTVVEAVFTSPDKTLEPLFVQLGVEWMADELVVRREVSATGRSRAFVNDTPVTLQTLTAVTRNLVDIHSQNSNIRLSESSNHLVLLDAYIGNENLLQEYKGLFTNYVEVRSKIKKIKERIEKNRESRELIAFQLEQLDKIKPREGELRQIEREFDILSDADQIREELGSAYAILDGRDDSVLSQISEAETGLQRVDVSFFAGEETDIPSRLSSLKIELKDIAETLRANLERIDSDPTRLSKVTARMNLLYDAIKRFKVKDDNELVALHNDLRHRLNEIDFGDEDIVSLEKEGRILGKKLKEKAELLTETRKAGAIRLSEELLKTAKPLGLPNLRFEVDFTQGKLTSTGGDSVEFLCSFNKNHPLNPVSKVASGGEMARLMLSLKSILARCTHLPTVIFDEVDTGVSGEIADKMGKMMKEMGEDMQVIAITHLPQVASKGESHLKVYKNDDGERTVSHIRQLDLEGRIAEIASMLSGSEVNEAARLNAKVLLGLE